MTVSGDRMLSYDMIGKREYVAYPLDEKLYSLDEEEAAFFKSQTGIDDDEELKRHILRSQKEAYEVRLLVLLSATFSERHALLTTRYSRTRYCGGSCSRGKAPSSAYIYPRTVLTWTPPSGSRSRAIGSTKTS